MTHERKISETTMGMTHTHTTTRRKSEGISQSTEMNVGLNLKPISKSQLET
jgi:hypothetical protein